MGTYVMEPLNKYKSLVSKIMNAFSTALVFSSFITVLMATAMCLYV